jgi:GTP cyclohydrolase IIa
VQATLFQLDNYGPWTTTPEPRPEMRLQALQARLYADVTGAVGRHEGYAFYGRGDNVLALTPGMDREAHERLLAALADRYPVSVSVGVGAGSTPLAALSAASERLQGTGSAQDPDRTGDLVGEFGGAGPLAVAHFDVVDATGRYTDERDAYAAYRGITRGVSAVADRLAERGALTFFVGCDNAVAVCPPLEESAYQAVLAAGTAVGVEFRVGVGAGETPAAAGMDAKHALERGRETGERFTRPVAEPAGPAE